MLSAFRAQGELSWRKEGILQDLREIFRISEERHRLELARVNSEACLGGPSLYESVFAHILFFFDTS